MMKKTWLALGVLSAAFITPVTANANNITLNIEVPKLDVAEYHRPYVAAWIENENGQFINNLTVWYDIKLRNNEGEDWLKDMRQWWRKSGRTLSLPVDGVTGATRPVGTHTLSFSTTATPFKELEAGAYQLRVEAAREVGGRELITLPFTWPADTEITHQKTGRSELGTISFTISP